MFSDQDFFRLVLLHVHDGADMRITVLVILVFTESALVASEDGLMSFSNPVKSWLQETSAHRFTFNLSVFDEESRWMNLGGERVRSLMHGSIVTIIPMTRFSPLPVRSNSL